MKYLVAALVALCLAACAGVVTPSPITSTGEQMRLWLMYGAGGSITSGGVDMLKQRIGAKYGSRIKVIGPYQWTQAAQIGAEMTATPPSIKAAVEGYSCGAAAAPDAAAATNRTVDLVAGIQPSLYCGGATLSANVLAALDVYNPTCIETGGLGCRLYATGPGFVPARLTHVYRYDAHPYADDDPDAQNDVIAAIGTALNATPKMAAPRNVSPRIIVRHSTW